MATWTGTGSWVSSYVGTLTATETSYDVDTNKSTLTLALDLTNSAYNYFRGYNCTYSISIDGSIVTSGSFTGYMEPNQPQQNHSLSFLSGFTVDVPHDADGSKTINISATMTTGTGYDSNHTKIGAGTINITGGTMTLTTIPRASTLSAPSIPIGSAGSLTITASSPSFIHNVYWDCAGVSGTVGTNLSAGTVSFTPPNNGADSLLVATPTATSASIVYTIETYNGATLIGTNTTTSTVTVPPSIKPSAPTVIYSDVNTIPFLTANDYLVAGYTRLRVGTSSTPGTGATLVDSFISVGDQTGTVAPGSTFTTPNVIPTAGNVTVSVTARDSRGRTNTNTTTVTFLQYSAPSVSSLKAIRGTYSGGNWSSDPTGLHIRVKFTVAVSLAGNIPYSTVSIPGETPDPDPAEFTTTTGTVYYVGTNATTEYTATITVVDELGVTITKSVVISTISVPINMNLNLPALGLGKLATRTKMLESAWDMEVEKTTASEVGITVKNANSEGRMRMSSGGVFGLYDETNSRWTIYDDLGGLTLSENLGRSVTSNTTSTYTLPVITGSGKVYRLAYNGATTVTLPTSAPVGYDAYLMPVYANQRITINTSGTEQMFVKGAASAVTTTTTDASYTLVHVIKLTTARWIVAWN